MYLHKYVNNIVLLSLTILASLTLITGPVFADSINNTASNQNNTASANLIPLEISPECSDSASATAYWQVNNKNTTNVSVTWTNLDNGHTGSYVAAPGLSQLTTYFDSSDPNNTTQFISETNTTQTNATEAACNPIPTNLTPPAPACVDGNIQQNLDITWVNPGEATVHTVNDAPLCNNVTLDISSYIMPANYNGQGFYTVYDQNNPSVNIANITAFPQTIFSNQTATLVAGSDGQTSLNINLPDLCNNIQVDIYYAPEQDSIGANGSGTANIASQIYTSSYSCDNQAGSGNNSGTSTPSNPAAPSTGGKGAGIIPTPQNIPMQTAAVILPSSANQSAIASTLAYTGESPVEPYLIAFGLMAATTALAYDVRKDTFRSSISK
jgi:hypothetical protein